MRSILEEFACGNISSEPHSFERNSQYGQTIQKLADCESKLLAMLGEAEKEIFQQFVDAQSEISLLSGIDRFVYGYRLGVLMTNEVYEGKDRLTAG